MKKERRTAPFFGLNDKMPIFLAALLGFQHALSMLAGIITPPIILSGTAGANLTPELQQYVSGVRFKVLQTISMANLV
jgi:xanthine/uracil permease